jgi:hypothetical protein
MLNSKPTAKRCDGEKGCLVILTCDVEGRQERGPASLRLSTDLCVDTDFDDFRAALSALMTPSTKARGKSRSRIAVGAAA